MRVLKRTLVSAGALLLLSSVAVAQEASLGQAELNEALLGLTQARGDGYVQGRDALLARAGVQEALSARVANATWSETTWQADALASAALVRLSDPPLVDKVHSLRGVRPSHYLARRRPGPEVLRDLRHMGAPAAPLMLELLLKTAERYPYPADFPARLGEEEIASWQAQEKTALMEGLLVAVGHTRHAGALPLLSERVADASLALNLRRAAAIGLGLTAAPDALAPLAELSADAEQDVTLRAAALQGVASVRVEAALEILVSSLDTTEDTLLRAAVASLGTFGSSWAWEAEGQAAAGEALRLRAAEAVVAVLARDGTSDTIRELATQAIAAIAHPAVDPALQAVADDDSRPEGARQAARAAQARLQLALRRR